MFIESIGIFGSVTVLIAMCFKTNTFKGSLFLRIFNLIGSIVLTIYGFLLPTYSTAVLNTILIFINLYHLIKLCIIHKKEKLLDN